MARRRRFPVLFLRLHADEPGWVDGYRYVVQQVDGDEHYFKTRRRAEAFLKVHAMKPQTDEAMEAIRQGRKGQAR